LAWYEALRLDRPSLLDHRPGISWVAALVVASVKLVVELTDAQVKGVVLTFLSGISESNVQWLLSNLHRSNFHGMVHTDVVHKHQRIVMRECGLTKDSFK
jgi:hypothetical protein